MREKVLLICEECLSRNYQTTINKDAKKTLIFKKFCPKCNKHTLHKISKQEVPIWDSKVMQKAQ